MFHHRYELAFAQKQAHDEIDQPWAGGRQQPDAKQPPQRNPLPELASLEQQVLENHKLVTAKHQSAPETKELEEFAKVMHIQGVRTDAAQLSDTEIKKIQEALHVRQDGKIGEKTMHALMHAEEIHALPTPSNPAPAVPRER